jgi:hypothetical protein
VRAVRPQNKNASTRDRGSADLDQLIDEITVDAHGDD